MTATVLPLDGEGHQAVQMLLPWFALGRLDASDREQVQAHLNSCPACRAELDWEQRMRSVQAADSLETLGDAERGLDRLHRRIEASPGAAAQAPRWRWPWRGQPLRWLAAAQFAAIAGLLAMVLVPHAPPALFHGLAARPDAATASWVVRFRPEATEREIRRALRVAGASLVGGPTVTDAYLLSAPAAGQAAALERLRAQPVVELAISLESASGP